MPLYEYQCGKCRKVFELLIRNTADEKAVACPHCRNKKVTKQLSTFRMGGGGSNDSAGGSGGGKSGCSSCASGSCSTCH